MKDIESLKKTFQERGQGHVFRFWDDLGDEGRERLAAQLSEIDLDELDQLTETLVKGGGKAVSLEGVEPAPYIPRPESGGSAEDWEKARLAGEQALRAGKVAAFTVAGGQGTRLGFDGPKGAYPATPLKKKPLFQVFAEKIKAASVRYDREVPWLIMTSHANHQQTVDCFREHDYFGLDHEQVFFFRQGRMPAVDGDGKIMLEAKDSVAMSPDGHGGSLRALVRSGAIARIKAAGVEAISYFQIDNPLVKCVDPAFVGWHFLKSSEMSSKTIPKAFPLEKLGHFCSQGGRTVVIEYSDMPEAMQQETVEGGQLRFRAGSIAIHMLDVAFVERMGEGSERLPFHRADKKIAFVNDEGATVKPDSPNGIKFEMFVFDALPMAKNPVIIETRRESDFSPIKSPTGVDSAESSRAHQMREWASWLAAAGVQLETDDAGVPKIEIEISPVFADSKDAFIRHWKQLIHKPEVKDGLYIGAGLLEGHEARPA